MIPKRAIAIAKMPYAAVLRHASRFSRDARGIAAVEFALVAPVMLIMLLGAVEITRAVSLERRFSQATSAVADLIGREATITAADVNAMYQIVGQIMSPYDASSLKISIIPVQANPANANQTKVYAATANRPSRGGAAQPPKCSGYVMTSGLLKAGASAIVVESSFSYVPMFAGYVMSNVTWTDKAIISPRNSCVDFDNNKCLSGCF
jgi:Flp pilus assembly protein TadG